MIRGRPSHIEDALCRMHGNQWFMWTDIKNKIYENLRLATKVVVDVELLYNTVT